MSEWCSRCHRPRPEYITDPTCPEGGYCEWQPPSTPTNLAEALMEEIRRVRDVVMPVYLALEDKRASAFVLSLMRRDMDFTIRALAEQDATKCLAILPALKGYTL